MLADIDGCSTITRHLPEGLAVCCHESGPSSAYILKHCTDCSPRAVFPLLRAGENSGMNLRLASHLLQLEKQSCLGLGSSRCASAEWRECGHDFSLASHGFEVHILSAHLQHLSGNCSRLTLCLSNRLLTRELKKQALSSCDTFDTPNHGWLRSIGAARADAQHGAPAATAGGHRQGAQGQAGALVASSCCKG